GKAKQSRGPSHATGLLRCARNDGPLLEAAESRKFIVAAAEKLVLLSAKGGRWLTRRPLAIDSCRLGAVAHPRKAFADAICPSGQRSGAVVDCSQRGPGACRGSKNQRKGLPVLSNGLQSPRRLRAPLRHRGGRHLMIITPLRLDTRRPRSGPSRRMGAPSCFETLSPG